MASTSAYQRTLKEGLEEALKIAKAARKLGLDPAAKPEIHITKDLAERVEALIGVKGLSTRIHELEKDGLGREEIALRIGQDFVERRFGQFDRVATIEHAVRTAVAILTEGVVAAPIEGIARVESDRNDNGTEYIKVFYSGPIRSAGGTAQALSVLAADYIRRQMGFAAYQPRDDEIGRYVLEVSVYERIAGLQYKPSDEEIREIVKSCPICIDGDPTEEREVGGYMGLQRVATDRVRGGMVLVLTEGVAMKAPKIKRHVDRLGLAGWDWVTSLVKAKGEKPQRDFLADLIAGRPVFGRPAAKGAFRLRYGRARNTGLETVGLNPVTMSLLKFTAAGTQIKPELPGKAGCVVPVDSIEGPTVKLEDGSLVRLDDADTLAALEDTIAEIVDLGEILIDYGDFLETGHRLMPAAYAHEWWVQELATKSEIEAAKWHSKTPSQSEALEIAATYQVPLHPAYTYLWEDLTGEDRAELAAYISANGVLDASTLLLRDDETGRTKRMLEDLLVPHRMTEQPGSLVISEPRALLRSLGLDDKLQPDESVRVTVRSKGPTRIGMRMGRPEKSKERRMKPAPHSLFPVGEYGGKSRLLKEALRVTAERPVIELEIQALGRADQLTTRARTKSWEPKKRSIDLQSYYENTMKGLGEPMSTTNLEVKCVRGLITKHKVAEHLGKGILRAKHDVVVFKDGTIRYDFTNLPLTHFYPKEIRLSVETARELGYTRDILGVELTNELQMLELKQQDLVISLDAASYLVRVSQFVDALLTQFYGLAPFYHATRKEDLIGHLVLGLAPHTSAGILSRIIGFTSASACYAHPFFHAAKRRNCLAPTTETILVDSRGVGTTELELLYRAADANEEVVDDFGTTRKAVAGMKTYALNPETGQFELKEIKAVLKTPAPAYLFAVRTNTGRTWVSSPEHRMVVWSNGTVKAKKLLELTEDDKLLLPALTGEESPRVTSFGDCILDAVKELKAIPSAFEFLYDLEVADHHNFLINNFVLSSNCDGDEDSVLLLLDALLNFSLFFLPEKRGGKMDAPLVLIPFLNPKEVDKEAHNVSTASEYPLALYEAACAGKMPKEVEIETAASKIEQPRDTYGFGYTHGTTDIAAGPINSLYKQLDSMIEKMEAQLRLARMIRAVNETEVAETVIANHFLRDIKGNLRAFGSQTMRCNKCNAKYRRIPLNGICKRCGGKIVPTVHAASVRKYLEVSLRIAEEYHVSRYTKQRLELLDKDIQALFPVALEQQKALSDFM
ncbi:MAG TPA: DNA polymerase II large subunit [Methanomicrobia archaeon]|nr:DNA polymerase II large subunit [Methanomicrobia archaeon]